MIGISDADIGSGLCGYIGYNIVVYLSVIGIKAHIDVYIGIDRLKILYGFFVYGSLGLVRIVLCPEGYLVMFVLVKAFGNGKSFESL